VASVTETTMAITVFGFLFSTDWPPATTAARWDAIAQRNGAALVRSLPKGIKASVGKHCDSLSGGRIQRLGPAGSSDTRPRLLVLHEATPRDAETEAVIPESLALPKRSHDADRCCSPNLYRPKGRCNSFPRCTPQQCLWNTPGVVKMQSAGEKLCSINVVP